MKKLVIANMKMNLLLSEIQEYVSKIKHENNVIICPTSIYIPYFSSFNVGIQNVFYENNGSYTGEISPKQAKSLGVNYAIIGHSERRRLFEETNQIINKKIKKALENDLKVILCIGEQEGQNLIETLNTQLEECLKELESVTKIIVAYEPVWAIGTQKTPTMEQISKTIQYIKDYIYGKYETSILVLYGGSVSKDNIEELNKIENVDGFLVGTAAKSINELNKIIEVTNR